MILYPMTYEPLVRRALLEDLGRAGDLTTNAIVGDEVTTAARIVARQQGRMAGVEVAEATFKTLDPRMAVTVHIADGDDAPAGATVAVVEGPARSLLAAERVALNFLGQLSGIATTTLGIAQAVAEYDARVVCTRKTTPTLRLLEKHAVRMGGGHNHRFGLDDAVLVKDNHIAIAGGVTAAVKRVQAAVGHMVKVEVEVDSLTQLEEALSLGVDAVLLDNMTLDELRQAVGIARGRAITEASGGIRPDTAADIAATGVDLLSVGWITHSAPSLDVALDVDVQLGL